MNRQQQKKAVLSIGQSTDSYQINDSEKGEKRVLFGYFATKVEAKTKMAPTMPLTLVAIGI